MTLSGQVLGSPNFISPEQAEGRSARIGPASDVYSLGALLYHLLTRQPPFQAETLTTLLKQVIETDPVPPRRLNPEHPARPGNDLPQVPGERAGATIRDRAGAGGGPGPFSGGKADPGPAGWPSWQGLEMVPSEAGSGRHERGAGLDLLLGLAGVLWQWHRAEADAGRNSNSASVPRPANTPPTCTWRNLRLESHNRELALEIAGQTPARASGKPQRRKQKAATDLRGWEWRYLWQLCQGDELLTLHRYPRPINGLASLEGREVVGRGDPERGGALGSDHQTGH